MRLHTSLLTPPQRVLHDLKWTAELTRSVGLDVGPANATDLVGEQRAEDEADTKAPQVRRQRREPLRQRGPLRPGLHVRKDLLNETSESKVTAT